uniref:Disease resistance protein At4g27190-like leucine-rich repeats domain-containing protein n=1 Tax=Salix viminalis TaxID=40686 RepID=A0A6N2M3V6_SALVM
MEEIIGGTRSDEEGLWMKKAITRIESFCSAKLICNSLKKIGVRECNSIEILFPSSWRCLLNLEEIMVVKCKKMEKIIGGIRSDEKGAMLRELCLSNLPELKSICRAKETCDSLREISDQNFFNW